MATTTPNNGWAVPTSTDYVKDGATAIETLGDAIDTSVGSGLLVWQTYAPTLSGGFANGNGVWDAKYCKIGKTVHVEANFTFGTTTTKGAGMNVSLPVNAAAGSYRTIFVMMGILGGSTYFQTGFVNSATTASFRVLNVAGTYPTGANVSATAPATWATNDNIVFGFTYQCV